ncbi:MAG: AzlC family ABC transporter permease [Christensenellaceae bacterium]|nr:AzlC family ABC transporter permease [Christensenellaceae bacterium]
MKKTIHYAFVRSIPVMFGYIFLGIAFGLVLQEAGFGTEWAFLSSLLIYAGSMQFLLPSLITGASWLEIAVMTVLVNGRHLFYGLSFIDKFKKMGKTYPYMIFSLTDETFSVLCSITDIPDGVDEKKASFLIALFDHFYWVTGSVIGGLAGHYIKFNSTGIDFAMTALFIVIFLDQWKGTKNHIPAALGLLVSIGSLCLLGAERFLLPALAITVALLIILRPIMQQKEAN